MNEGMPKCVSDVEFDLCRLYMLFRETKFQLLLLVILCVCVCVCASVCVCMCLYLTQMHLHRLLSVAHFFKVNTPYAWYVSVRSMLNLLMPLFNYAVKFIDSIDASVSWL